MSNFTIKTEKNCAKTMACQLTEKQMLYKKETYYKAFINYATPGCL